jgi:hypothetical protein
VTDTYSITAPVRTRRNKDMGMTLGAAACRWHVIPHLDAKLEEEPTWERNSERARSLI